MGSRLWLNIAARDYGDSMDGIEDRSQEGSEGFTLTKAELAELLFERGCLNKLV